MKRFLPVLVTPALLIGTLPLLSFDYEVTAAPISIGVKGVERGGDKKLKAIPIAKAPKSAPARPVDLKGLPKKPAPAYKGGQKTKVTTFILNIDNRTNEYVDAFVNGEYRGTIEPWGDGNYYAASGSTNIFCRGLDGNSYWTATIYKISGNHDISLNR